LKKKLRKEVIKIFDNDDDDDDETVFKKVRKTSKRRYKTLQWTIQHTYIGQYISQNSELQNKH